MEGGARGAPANSPPGAGTPPHRERTWRHVADGAPQAARPRCWFSDGSELGGAVSCGASNYRTSQWKRGSFPEPSLSRSCSGHAHCLQVTVRKLHGNISVTNAASG